MRIITAVVFLVAGLMIQSPETILDFIGVGRSSHIVDAPYELSRIWGIWDEHHVNFKVRSPSKISWLKAPQIVSKIFELREPALILDSPIDKWKAVKDPSLWSPASIQEHIKKIRGVHVNKPGMLEFLYAADEKPMKSSGWKPRSLKYNMSTDQLFHLLNPNATEQKRKGWHSIPHGSPAYYSGCLCNRDWQKSKLSKTIGPYEEILGDYLEQRRPKPDKPMYHVWMGGAGVSVAAHYDAVHNLYTQIRGRKRFVLFPPTANRALYAHSRLNPHARQTQVNFSSPDPRMREFFQGGLSDAEEAQGVAETHLKGYDIILNPGDVLYVPPYWYHYVTALESSVSVSLWVDAEDAEWFKEVSKLPVPKPKVPKNHAHSTISHAQFVFAILGRVRDALEHLSGITHQRHVGQSAIPVEFLPLSPLDALDHILEQRFYTHSSRIEATKEAGKEPVVQVVDLESCRLDSSYKKFSEQLEGTAKGVALGLTRVPDERYALTHTMLSTRNAFTDMTRTDLRAIVEMQTFDYVEEYLRASLGTERIVPFLRAMLMKCGRMK